MSVDARAVFGDEQADPAEVCSALALDVVAARRLLHPDAASWTVLRVLLLPDVRGDGDVGFSQVGVFITRLIWVRSLETFTTVVHLTRAALLELHTVSGAYRADSDAVDCGARSDFAFGSCDQRLFGAGNHFGEL